MSFNAKLSPFVLCAIIVAGCTEGQFEERTIDTSGLSRVDNPDARIGMLKSALAQNPQDVSALKSLKRSLRSPMWMLMWRLVWLRMVLGDRLKRRPITQRRWARTNGIWTCVQTSLCPKQCKEIRTLIRS